MSRDGDGVDLKGEGFEHGADDGEAGEDVAVGVSGDTGVLGFGVAYIVGLKKTRLTRLLNAMLCVSRFFGGRRLMANCLSSALMHRLPVDSGRSGNVNCKVLAPISSSLETARCLRIRRDRREFP